MECSTIGACQWVGNEPIGKARLGVFPAPTNRLQIALDVDRNPKAMQPWRDGADAGCRLQPTDG
ncbi:hypothetical protein ASD00_26630 [Ensifer sp. Root31]|nr:hypothetical protein ASD00_26630 [Ensifer sp. Root31]